MIVGKHFLAASEPARRYLLSLVRKTGTVPQRIPSERDLAEKLGLARGTVRNAIADLEANFLLIRLPGKKGAFTNPGAADMLTVSIGVVSKTNWFHNLHQQILYGFCSVLSDNAVDYSLHYEIISDISDRQFFKVLRHSGHALLLNFGGKSISEKLIQTGIPVVDYIPDLLFDEDQAGRSIAEFFIQRSCRNMIFWSTDEIKLAFVKKYMPGVDIFSEKMSEFNAAECSIPDRILNTADGIFAGVNLRNINNLLEHLARKNIRCPILLQPTMQKKALLQQFPDLDLHFMDQGFYQKSLIRIGKQLGNNAVAMLNGTRRTQCFKTVPYYKVTEKKIRK